MNTSQIAKWFGQKGIMCDILRHAAASEMTFSPWGWGLQGWRVDMEGGDEWDLSAYYEIERAAIKYFIKALLQKIKIKYSNPHKMWHVCHVGGNIRGMTRKLIKAICNKV